LEGAGSIFMMLFLGDFRQFFGEKMAFFLKTDVTILFFCLRAVI
jgi:hypothetical protein